LKEKRAGFELRILWVVSITGLCILGWADRRIAGAADYKGTSPIRKHPSPH